MLANSADTAAVDALVGDIMARQQQPQSDMTTTSPTSRRETLSFASVDDGRHGAERHKHRGGRGPSSKGSSLGGGNVRKDMQGSLNVPPNRARQRAETAMSFKSALTTSPASVNSSAALPRSATSMAETSKPRPPALLIGVPPPVMPSRTASLIVGGGGGIEEETSGEKFALSSDVGVSTLLGVEPGTNNSSFYRPASTASAFTQRLNHRMLKVAAGGLPFPEGGEFMRQDTNSSSFQIAITSPSGGDRSQQHYQLQGEHGKGAFSVDNAKNRRDPPPSFTALNDISAIVAKPPALVVSDATFSSVDESEAQLKASEIETQEALQRAEATLKELKSGSLILGENHHHLTSQHNSSGMFGEDDDNGVPSDRPRKAILAKDARKNVQIVPRPAGQSNTERSLYQNMLRASSAVARHARTPAGLLQINTQTGEPLSVSHPLTTRMTNALLAPLQPMQGGGGGGLSSRPLSPLRLRTATANAPGSPQLQRKEDSGSKSLASKLLDAVFAPTHTSVESILLHAGSEAIQQAARRGRSAGKRGNLMTSTATATASLNVSSPATGRVGDNSATKNNANNSTASILQQVHEATALARAELNASHNEALLNTSGGVAAGGGDYHPHHHSQQQLNVSRPRSSASSNNHRAQSSGGTFARSSRMAFNKMSMLVDAEGSKETSSRSRARTNALNNILAVINDDPKAKEEVMERAARIRLQRYGRGFSANTLTYPPKLAEIIKNKREMAEELEAMGGGGGIVGGSRPSTSVVAPVVKQLISAPTTTHPNSDSDDAEHDTSAGTKDDNSVDKVPAPSSFKKMRSPRIRARSPTEGNSSGDLLFSSGDEEGHSALDKNATGPTNWMARNANRARLHHHLAEADRIRFLQIEQNRYERALQSREEQFYAREAALDAEASTVRGAGKSASHRWATIITLIASAKRMHDLVAAQKVTEAEALNEAAEKQTLLNAAEEASANGGVLSPEAQLVLDEASTARMLAVVTRLQTSPQFLKTIRRFKERRRDVATHIIKTFIISVRDASKIQMRIRQLLGYIRVIQRNVRRYLVTRRHEKALWLQMIQLFIDERLAFTRQITIDFEKEMRRRKLALMANCNTKRGATSHPTPSSSPAGTHPHPHHASPSSGGEDKDKDGIGPSDNLLTLDAAAVLIQLHGINGTGPGIGGSIHGAGGKKGGGGAGGGFGGVAALQGALLAVRTANGAPLTAGKSKDSKTSDGGRASTPPLKMAKGNAQGARAGGGGGGSSGGGGGGIPLILANEATRVLSIKMNAIAAAQQQHASPSPKANSSMMATSINVPSVTASPTTAASGGGGRSYSQADNSAAAGGGGGRGSSAASVPLNNNPNVTIYRHPTVAGSPAPPPLIIHHSQQLSRRYANFAVQRAVEVMRARVEHGFTRMPADELFAVSCLPAAVARCWRNAAKAVFFARETHELPHADRTAIRLPSTYKEALVKYFRRLQLSYYHQQVARWRAVYQKEKAKYEWEKELAANAAQRNGMDPKQAMAAVKQVIPPFPTRKHIPTAAEGRFVVLVGFAIQFLEKRALLEVSATISQRANVKTAEGQKVLNHEKLTIAQKSLSDENIAEVTDRLYTKYLTILVNGGSGSTSGGGGGPSSVGGKALGGAGTAHAAVISALGGLSGLSDAFVTGELPEETPRQNAPIWFCM